MSSKVYICSPFRAMNVAEARKNVERTQKACRMALRFGFNPVAPHLFYPQFLDDNDPREHHRGMVLALESMLECEQVWVFGEPSEGMKAEIDFAKEKHVPIFFKELRHEQDK